MSDELTIVENLNPVAVYSGGLDAVLEDLAKQAKSIVTDISTDAGRKEIASLAYKIARSKTLLDSMGEKLGEDARAKVSAINADRKRARDFLDALKEEIRKPLTDFENAEKNRILLHETNLSAIAALTVFEFTPNSDQILYRKTQAKIIDHKTFEEFCLRAASARTDAINKLSAMYNAAVTSENEAKELARLREEESRRIQHEREAKLKQEAADAARKEAEDRASELLAVEKAKEEKARHEAAAAEERAKKADNARMAAAEQAEKDMIAAAAKADADRIAESERAAAAMIAAAENAKREQESAVEAERNRIASIKKADEDAALARENDKKHKAKINNEVLVAISLIAADTDDEYCKAIVIAIASGKIPHVKINY